MAVDPSLTLAQFNYHLPDELIAQFPAKERTQSRLLYVAANGSLHDQRFPDLLQHLRPNDLLVFNNTKVIKARLVGQKASGGKIEVLIERITGEHTALAHIRASKSPKPGQTLYFADQQLSAEVMGRQDALFELRFNLPALEALEQFGQLPLPPYIAKQPTDEDEKRYQTVYASELGAVAAPTAGLHFDDSILAALDQLGVQRAYVTLHVGAGTFQPVKVEQLDQHIMHAERFHVPECTLKAIEATQRAGGRVVAIGTTSVRALESAAQLEQCKGERLSDGSIQGDTQLFITPGYTFKWVDALLTNFHLPQSTLLMLVSALSSIEIMQQAYAHAIQQRYRFFSYGDAMFIEGKSS